MTPKMFFLKSIRKFNRITGCIDNEYDESRVELVGQKANDYVKRCIGEAISKQKGLLLCKLGTIELNALCCYYRRENGINFTDYIDYIHGKGTIFPEESIEMLCSNAGFFPKNLSLQKEFCSLMLNNIKEIDILGSYVNQETYISSLLDNVKYIQLDGYLAPYLWQNPWSEILKNKKVLVIHPFAESIKSQYQRRDKLFIDKAVLPSFEKLTIIQAVQSIAGNGKETRYHDWFEALADMESDIDKTEFDIALIGCGAYGLPLAAYCKKKGKIAVHLGGWLQMLFGIYGKRWIEDQPQYKKFVNKYWVRPSEKERPKNLHSVENGAYW